MLERLVFLLTKKGYALLDNNMPGVYIRETEQVVYAITLTKAEAFLQQSDYALLQKQLEHLGITRFNKPVQVLHFVSADNGMFSDNVLQLLESFDNIWLFAQDTGKIYIFEKQPADFDNLYHVLSDELNMFTRHNKLRYFVTPINFGIVACNLLLFLGITLVHKDIFATYDAALMLKMGAMNCERVKNGAWYLLVTSMFLHFGWKHLFDNMLLLSYVGCELERIIGKIPYFLLYITCGVVGNVASYLYYSGIGQIRVVSAGASGAIFGVLGALLVLLLVRGTKMEDVTPGRLTILLIFTLYYGFTEAGVDNAAHIGGLICGIIGGFLLSKISYYGKLE